MRHIPDETLKVVFAIVGTLIFGFLQFVAIAFIWFSAFGFFNCGNDWLELYANILSGFIISSVLLFFELLLCRLFYKEKRAVIRFTFPVITFFLFLEFLVMGYEVVNRSKYFEKFDKEVWLSKEEKPIAMIRAFHKNKRFIGVSRAYVFSQLGEGTSTYYCQDSSCVQYEVFEHGYSPLIIEFEKDTVVNLYLSCND